MPTQTRHLNFENARDCYELGTKAEGGAGCQLICAANDRAASRNETLGRKGKRDAEVITIA